MLYIELYTIKDSLDNRVMFIPEISLFISPPDMDIFSIHQLELVILCCVFP